MIGQDPKGAGDQPAAEHDEPRHPDQGNAAEPSSDGASRPEEFGGRPGPDPVRYGDWEKNGRCIDF